MKAYYMLIQESGGVPAINIYFQDFKDFFDSPNLSAKDHALLEACADPEGLAIQLKHAQDLQEMANKMLKPLYINLADQSTQSYFDTKGELLVAIQRFLPDRNSLLIRCANFTKKAWSNTEQDILRQPFHG